MQRFLAWLSSAFWRLVNPPSEPSKPRCRIEYWRSAWDQQWHWHARAGNGEIIAQGEAYHNRKDLLDTLNAYFPNMPRREVPQG